MPLVSVDLFKGLPLYITVCFVVLFFYLPGYLLWKLLLVRAERFRKFCMEEYGLWSSSLTQMVISILITGWLGFLLGEAGIFNIYLLAGIIGLLCTVPLIIEGPKK